MGSWRNLLPFLDFTLHIFKVSCLTCITSLAYCHVPTSGHWLSFLGLLEQIAPNVVALTQEEFIPSQARSLKSEGQQGHTLKASQEDPSSPLLGFWSCQQSLVFLGSYCITQISDSMPTWPSPRGSVQLCSLVSAEDTDCYGSAVSRHWAGQVRQPAGWCREGPSVRKGQGVQLSISAGTEAREHV